MSKPLVTDKLSALVAPLPLPALPQPGAGPGLDRVCLIGIIFVLQSGIP